MGPRGRDQRGGLRGREPNFIPRNAEGLKIAARDDGGGDLRSAVAADGVAAEVEFEERFAE